MVTLETKLQEGPSRERGDGTTRTRIKKNKTPSLHGPDDGVVPQVLVARPRRHGLL